ncbi:MAG: hypothetical protein AAGF24_11470 [Cyanobacteria bacterium P01_H01_bin.121]
MKVSDRKYYLDRHRTLFLDYYDQPTLSIKGQSGTGYELRIPTEFMRRGSNRVRTRSLCKHRDLNGIKAWLKRNLGGLNFNLRIALCDGLNRKPLGIIFYGKDLGNEADWKTIDIAAARQLPPLVPTELMECGG